MKWRGVHLTLEDERRRRVDGRSTCSALLVQRLAIVESHGGVGCVTWHAKKSGVSNFVFVWGHFPGLTHTAVSITKGDPSEQVQDVRETRKREALKLFPPDNQGNECAHPFL